MKNLIFDIQTQGFTLFMSFLLPLRSDQDCSPACHDLRYYISVLNYLSKKSRGVECSMLYKFHRFIGSRTIKVASCKIVRTCLQTYSSRSAHSLVYHDTSGFSLAVLVIVRVALFVVYGNAFLDILHDRNGFIVLPASLALRLLGLPGNRHRHVFANLKSNALYD